MPATDEEWAVMAKRLFKAELKRVGVTYAELAKRLTEAGLPETEGSVTMKINRGAFPAWFFFASMKAVGCHVVRLEDA